MPTTDFPTVRSCGTCGFPIARTSKDIMKFTYMDFEVLCEMQDSLHEPETCPHFMKTNPEFQPPIVDSLLAAARAIK